MRKLIYAINISLDGCCDHTKFFPEEDTMEYFIQLTRDTGTFLYGRKTYELMVPYWPDMAANPPADEREVDIEFAKAYAAVNNIVVFSRTLDSSAGGEKTRIVSTNLKEEILKLKQEPGKDILIGGVDLVSQLAELGLIDDYRLILHPLIAGGGRRVFDGINLHENLRLKLVDTTAYRSGAIVLRYVK